jgi:hypothetical protein
MRGYNKVTHIGGLMKNPIGFSLLLIFMLSITGCTITIDTGSEPTKAAPPPPAPVILPTATSAPVPTRIPVILSSGTIDIPQTYLADLDTGVIPKNPKDSLYNAVDLWFEAITPQERYLEPYNGATWTVVGPNQISYQDCLSMTPSPARMDIRNLPSGTYICVVTNIKNISIIRINSINYASKGSIRLDFTTWQP